MTNSKNNLYENLLNTIKTNELSPMNREYQFLIKNAKRFLIKAQKYENKLYKTGMPKSFLSAMSKHLTNFEQINNSLNKLMENKDLIDQLWTIKTEELKAVKNLLLSALSFYLGKHSAAWDKIRSLLIDNRTLPNENILIPLLMLLKDTQLELQNENLDLILLKNAKIQLEEAAVLNRLNLDHSISLSQCRHKHSRYYSMLQHSIEELEGYTRKVNAFNPAFF